MGCVDALPISGRPRPAGFPSRPRPSAHPLHHMVWEATLDAHTRPMVRLPVIGPADVKRVWREGPAVRLRDASQVFNPGASNTDGNHAVRTRTGPSAHSRVELHKGTDCSCYSVMKEGSLCDDFHGIVTKDGEWSYDEKTGMCAGGDNCHKMCRRAEINNPLEPGYQYACGHAEPKLPQPLPPYTTGKSCYYDKVAKNCYCTVKCPGGTTLLFGTAAAYDESPIVEFKPVCPELLDEWGGKGAGPKSSGSDHGGGGGTWPDDWDDPGGGHGYPDESNGLGDPENPHGDTDDGGNGSTAGLLGVGPAKAGNLPVCLGCVINKMATQVSVQTDRVKAGVMKWEPVPPHTYACQDFDVDYVFVPLENLWYKVGPNIATIHEDGSVSWQKNERCCSSWRMSKGIIDDPTACPGMCRAAPGTPCFSRWG